LILCAIELIVNYHSLDSTTGWSTSGDHSLTVSVVDWAMIQRGELDRFNVWTGGELKIDSGMMLMHQLEEAISKLSKG
jgi:putative sterol carrier protein